MKHLLKPLKVLITRPAHQAAPLGHLIETLGGTYCIMPTMEIIPINNPELSAMVNGIRDHDIVIYISANAVHCSQCLWSKNKPLMRNIAMGPGTANALKKYAVKTDCTPLQYSSEGLLQLAILQNAQAKSIFIFCGENTRPFLKEQLIERGAIVQEIACYQRRATDFTTSQLENIQREEISIAVSTSFENLKNLLDHIKKLKQYWLLNLPLIVINEKMQQAAKKIGFCKVLLAADASDIAIFETIKKWCTLS